MKHILSISLLALSLTVAFSDTTSATTLSCYEEDSCLKKSCERFLGAQFPTKTFRSDRTALATEIKKYDGINYNVARPCSDSELEKLCDSSGNKNYIRGNTDMGAPSIWATLTPDYFCRALNQRKTDEAQRKQLQKQEMNNNKARFTCIGPGDKEILDQDELPSMAEAQLSNYTMLACAERACTDFANDPLNNIKTYDDMSEKYRGKNAEAFAQSMAGANVYVDRTRNEIGGLSNNNALNSLIIDECLKDRLDTDQLYEKCNNDPDSIIIAARVPKDNTVYEDGTYLKYDSRLFTISCKNAKPTEAWAKLMDTYDYKHASFFFFAFLPDGALNINQGDEFAYPTDLDFLPSTRYVNSEEACFTSDLLWEGDTVINRVIKKEYGFDDDVKYNQKYFITHQFDRVSHHVIQAGAVVAGAFAGWKVGKKIGGWKGGVVGVAIGGGMAGGAYIYGRAIDALERPEFNDVMDKATASDMSAWFGVDFEEAIGEAQPVTPSMFQGVLAKAYGLDGWNWYEIVTPTEEQKARKMLKYLNDKLSRTSCAANTPYVCLVAVVPETKISGNGEEMPTGTFKRKIVDCLHLER